MGKMGLWSVEAAGAAAGLLSLATVVLVLVAVPGLIGEMADIRAQLDADMARFRVLAPF